MKKTRFCVFVLLLVSTITAQQNDDDETLEEWRDYDNFYDYGMIKEGVKNILPKSEETDMKVKEEIDRSQDDLYDDFEDNYQIEDNRSEEEINAEAAVDKKQQNENIEKSVEIMDLANDYNLLWGDSKYKDSKISESTTKKDESIIDEVIDKDPKAAIDNDYHLLWADDDMAPIPAPSSEEEESKILEETDKLLKEEDDKSDKTIPGAPADEIDTNLLRETLQLLKEDEIDGNSLDILPLSIENENNFNKVMLESTKNIQKDIETEPIPQDVQLDIENIVKETENLLKDRNSPNEEDISEQKHENLEEEIAKLADEIDKAEEKLENEVDDTVDNAMDDLNDDLDKLFETLDKLKEGIEETGAKAKDKVDEVFGSEEKDLFNEYNDEDYESIGDSNLSEIFAKINTSGNQDGNEDAADEVYDKTIKEILAEEAKIDSSLENKSIDDVNEEPNIDDDVESKQSDDLKPIIYQNDALLDGESEQDDTVVEQFDVQAMDVTIKANNPNGENAKETVNKDSQEIDEPNGGEKAAEANTRRTKMAEDLNSEELDNLMEQFKMVHKEELAIKSEDVSPTRVKLSVDEPVVVTSPNYPNPYPTNTVIDWLFEGDGLGVELNITDFSVNGAMQHYLLVKPGGVDASGTEGLVFSYHLATERRFRFLDVDRLFVRFFAGPGMMFARGFQFSVRMISPAASFEEDAVPEPEQLLPTPEETLTLNLGGLSIVDFHGVRAQFQQILADMAEAYIEENDIDPGLNATSEVTKIARTAVCNIRWPDYESCVELTFAVPLRYADADAEPRLDEQDLLAMWRRFYDAEPFASRLDTLGITEFSAPHERSVAMAWLAVGLGVLISALLLALALWRFSCFDDYTRLRAFRGAGGSSVGAGRKSLDLFPAPHQPVPQLFESEYKWAEPPPPHAAAVDMGGYANQSFARDEMFGFDSDEDVLHSRDRSRVISPRANYSEV